MHVPQFTVAKVTLVDAIVRQINQQEAVQHHIVVFAVVGDLDAVQAICIYEIV